MAAEAGDDDDTPWTAAIPAGGLPALIRIPLPGPGNLSLALRPPPGWLGPSTCTVFIMRDKWKGLRLDYSLNTATNPVDYHWNRKGYGEKFPIINHSAAGRGGALLYQGARAFRYAGTVVVVVGAVLDLESIAVASNPLRRSTQVVSSWALAWAGARGAGGVGAELGTIVYPGIGTAVGGLVLAMAGGAAGYWAGSKAGANVYDWAANTIFTDLPVADVPDDVVGMSP